MGKTSRLDKSVKKRVELHVHTQMSEMDAVTSVSELIMTAVQWGHEAIAITDHGVAQAFPEAMNARKRLKNDFKVIYGMEAYIINDSLYDSQVYHASVLVKNELGRANLYRLISESYITYFNGCPRIPKSLLSKYREGLLIGSACAKGELCQAILTGKTSDEIKEIVEYYDYLEIQPISSYTTINSANQNFDEKTKELEDINKEIVSLGDTHGKLVVATGNVHYLEPSDKVCRQIIKSKRKDEERGQRELHFRTTQEMLNEFSYLGNKKAEEVVIDNTLEVSRKIEKVYPISSKRCLPFVENAESDLREKCNRQAHQIYGNKLPAIVKTRLDKELKFIFKNGYASVYVIVGKLVKQSREDGYLVNPRSTIGASFVAWLMGITEINPLPAHYYCEKCHCSEFDSEEVKEFAMRSGFDMIEKVCPICGCSLAKEGHNLPLEEFMGEMGDREPDISLDFAGEYQEKAHEYIRNICGQKQLFRAGSILTIGRITAHNNVVEYFEEYEESKTKDEIERITEGCTGVKRATGQYPGRIVLLPDKQDIYCFTPIQHPNNNMKSGVFTTHFDYDSLDSNLMKFDLLGSDDPTMIRQLEVLTGEFVQNISFSDTKLLSLFLGTSELGIKPADIGGIPLGCLGIQNFDTDSMMNRLLNTKPKSFTDIVQMLDIPKANAVSYAMRAFRMAYFKVYHPLAYYATYFSTKVSTFDYRMMCFGKERLERYMDEYIQKKENLTYEENGKLKCMRIVQEMYARGYDFAKIDENIAMVKDFQIIGGILL